MDRETEERWRDALEAKGMEIVRAELDMRHGRPEDLMYDVCDEPPYPTRAFCEEWCRGAPPRGVGISGISATIIVMAVLMVVCVIHAISSYSPDDASWLAPHDGIYYRPPPPSNPRGSGGQSDDTVQNAMAHNSSQIDTTNQPSILSACSSVSNAHDLTTVSKDKPCMKPSGPPSMFNMQQQAPPSPSSSVQPSGGASAGSQQPQ